MLRRLSLKTRLVVGVLVLATLGLAAADVATYTSLRSFLVQRVDNTLSSEHTVYERNDGGGGPGPRHGPGPGPRGDQVGRQGQSNPFVQYRTRDGSTVIGTPD